MNHIAVSNTGKLQYLFTTLAIVLILGAGSGVASPKKGASGEAICKFVQPYASGYGGWNKVVTDCDKCGKLGKGVLDIYSITVDCTEKGKGTRAFIVHDLILENGQGVNIEDAPETKAKRMSLEGGALHLFFENGQEVVVHRKSPYSTEVSARVPPGSTAIAPAGIYGHNNNDVLTSAIMRHPVDGQRKNLLEKLADGYLAVEPAAAMAQPVAVAQTWIPDQPPGGTASGSSQSTPPNGQESGPTGPQQLPQTPSEQQAGTTDPQPRPQYPSGQTVDSGPDALISSSSSAGPSSPSVHPVNAASYNRCITVVEQQNGSVGLMNGCDQALNVRYCIANPKNNVFDCDNTNTAGGMSNTSANGGFAWIPLYKESGGGQVYFGACAPPASPLNWRWNGSSGSFVCQ
jgi:hypothetical protein